MKLGYTILYCKDVLATVQHYERAFGLRTSFVHESDLYAEMATGETTLAFASHDMAELNDLAIQPSDPKQVPGGFEIVLVTSDIPAAYERALENGATAVKPPASTPWGQTVAYVRDIDGCLVALATPVAAREEPEAG